MAASARMTWLSLAHASGKTIASDVPWKSSRVSRAYSLPGLLRDLPLEPRHHRRHAHLVLAPLVEGGRGAGAEELHLRAEPLQRVPGDEEADHFLLPGQALGLRQRGDVGEVVPGRPGGRQHLAEQGGLPRLPLLLPKLRLAEGGVQRLQVLPPMPAEPVAGAGHDQRLDDAAVAEPEVDPADEVPEVVEGAVAPGLDHRLDHAARPRCGWRRARSAAGSRRRR